MLFQEIAIQCGARRCSIHAVIVIVSDGIDEAPLRVPSVVLLFLRCREPLHVVENNELVSLLRYRIFCRSCTTYRPI